MVDFRYHLISIIAVFFALGLGIIMGSAVLDQQLVSRLKADVRAFNERNDDLQQQLDEVDSRIGAAERYIDESSAWLLDDALRGNTVVVVTVEGTDGSVVGNVQDAIQTAGGDVTGTIMLTDRLALRGLPDRDELALALGSTSERPRDLREEMAGLLGNRMGAAASDPGTTQAPQTAPAQRLGGMLGQLEEAGYIAADPDEAEDLVRPAASFAIIAGAEEGAGYDAASMTLAMVRSLARRGSPTLVAEPSYSTWGIVSVARGDADVAGEVSTVDQAENQQGRVGIVLGLRRAYEGATGHYGVGDGASEVLPEPPQS